MVSFELWAYGSGISPLDGKNYAVVARWLGEPDNWQVVKEMDQFLAVLEFDSVEQAFDGNNSHYDVLKDGQWKRVHFMLREN